jgi:hypothetical protein
MSDIDERGYQHGFSEMHREAMYDSALRQVRIAEKRRDGRADRLAGRSRA